MKLEVGQYAGNEEARLGLARARAGDHAAARDIGDRLCEIVDPPHVWLAEIFLEIGDLEKASEHVLEGYRWSWADGPPHVNAWELERCRTVLAALGEPEPQLPPFDPKKIEPFPYEDEIRKLIEEMKQKKDDQKS